MAACLSESNQTLLMLTRHTGPWSFKCVRTPQKDEEEKKKKKLRLPQQPGRAIARKVTENGTLSPPGGSPRQREPC